MNLLFGGMTPSAQDPILERMGEYITRTFDKQPLVDVHESKDDHAVLGTLSDDGVVIGRAAADGKSLAYIGAICAPLDGWVLDVSPLDDPNATAAYLLARYQKQGMDFLHGVNGQYALVLYDPLDAGLVLATDPYGGRTWYVSERDGAVYFSSLVAALATGWGDALEVDRGCEDFFLIYGFYPHGRTPYKHVRSLSPGSLISFKGSQSQQSKIVAANPWAEKADGNLPSHEAHAEAEAIESLYEAMLLAVREQLPKSKQKVAVLLGGFDSALVAAIINRLGYPVETYSFYYERTEFNQPHTQTLAEHLGIKHHWVKIDREIITQGMLDFTKRFNQPTNWPNYVIQTAHVCEQMRADGIRHCYSGDGCDAAFLGYPGTYQRARVFGALPVLPRWSLKLILGLAARPTLDRVFGHPYRVALNILRGLGRSMPARGYLSFRIMDEISLDQLRLGKAAPADQNIDELVRELSQPFEKLPLLRLAYQGKAAVSPNRNKLIGSADCSGLSILAPYMHPGLKHYALSLPEQLMRPKEKTKSSITGKYILMRMAEEKALLPAPVIYQKKMAAVDAPIDEWYAGPMRGVLEEIYRGLPFEYNKAYCRRLLDQKWTEKLFKNKIMTDNVISHAASLLATYARFTSIAPKPSTSQSSQDLSLSGQQDKHMAGVHRA